MRKNKKYNKRDKPTAYVFQTKEKGHLAWKGVSVD